jgi:glycosyltransferase involved in cell wall biosynthesis
LEGSRLSSASIRYVAPGASQKGWTFVVRFSLYTHQHRQPPGRVRHNRSAQSKIVTHFRTLADTVLSGATLFSLEHQPVRRLSRARREIRHARDGHQLALFAPLPPHTGAGVHRPLSFIRYGAKHGWRIDGFAGPAPDHESQHGEELLARVPASVRLHVVPPPSREPSYRFCPQVDGGFTNALAHARYAIDRLRQDPPDVVLASGPPFFTFVAARFVARHFSVPFVLDYRDEWTECPFDFVKKDRDDIKWERRCLADADAVLFATESFLKHQLGVFSQLDTRKAHVVPNGWDPDEFRGASRATSSTPHEEREVLRIAHVGSLSGHTPPLAFLESLRQLLHERPEWISRLEVSFVGRRSLSADAAIRAFPYPGVLRVVDQVGKREAIRLMHEADVLLLLAARELERYLPSKLFEYIASRRPVLIFGFAGESSTLIERLGAGALCAPGSGEMLGDALVRLRALDLSPHEEAMQAWMQNHRRDVLAARAFGIMESLSSRPSGERAAVGGDISDAPTVAAQEQKLG